MRRNILTYKAPLNNEGYDLICIHPDPRCVTKQIRVQVKSRYATDLRPRLPRQGKNLAAFDYLIVAFLNIGNFLSRRRASGTPGRREPEFYTLSAAFVEEHLDKTSSWEKVKLGNLNLEPYKNDLGFDLIADELSIEYPSKQ